MKLIDIIYNGNQEEKFLLQFIVADKDKNNEIDFEEFGFLVDT